MANPPGSSSRVLPAHMEMRQHVGSGRPGDDRILTPDNQKLDWLEREIDSLGDELYDTRMDLENAMGQDWARDDPSWAPRSPWSAARSRTPSTCPGLRPVPCRTGRASNATSGPDLGLGL